MRLTYLPFLALLSASAVGAVACGSVSPAQSSGSTTGSGGAGGGTTVTTSTTTVTDAGSDVDNGMVSTTYPAPHPPAPQVVYGGGAVLANPKLVPVFFSNEDATMETKLIDFVSKVGATKYWDANTSEYGVGPATSLPPVVLAEAAPATIDDTGIQTWLAGKLNGDDPAWPKNDPDTLYILHYPAGTTITLQSGGGTSSSCQSFGGYHDSITLDAAHGSADAAYAVVPRCQNFGNLTGIDAVTGAESHEIIEAATDAYPMTNPAYGQVDNAHIYWLFALGGGETGDMCAQFPDAFTKFSELPYTVQRTWSDKAAAAGADPCVPELPGEVYFNSAPVLPDNISIMGLGTMKGVKIPVGSSRTIDLDLFSEAATSGPWKVQVKDFAQLTGGTATMSFALDRDKGQNGEKLHLTIDVLKKNQFGAGIFIVISTLGTYQNWWFGLVSNN